MKILFLVTILHTCFAAAFSQKTVHGIFFADTRDKDMGEYCANDLKRMNNFCSNLATCLGYQYNPIVNTGEKFNSANFRSVSQQLTNSSDEDIIFLYVSAHGVASDNPNDSFPKIRFQDAEVPISEIHSSLQERKHRVLFTISDACNRHYPLKITLSESVIVSGDKAKKEEFADCVVANFNTLFLKKKFDLLLTSSGRGQNSIILPQGSIFTDVFINVMDDFTKNCLQPKLVDFEVILPIIKQWTSYSSGNACNTYHKIKSLDPGANCTDQSPIYRF